MPHAPRKPGRYRAYTSMCLRLSPCHPVLVALRRGSEADGVVALRPFGLVASRPGGPLASRLLGFPALSARGFAGRRPLGSCCFGPLVLLGFYYDCIEHLLGCHRENTTS